MARDMAVLMDDERLQSLVDGYTTRFPQYYWLRMVYSESGQALDLQVEELPRRELVNLTDDQRWFYHVLGGTGMTLEDSELESLMSATDNTARSSLTSSLL